MIRFDPVKLSRRRFLAAAGSLLASALAACGRGSSQSDESSVDQQESTPTPSPTPTLEPEPTPTSEIEAFEADPTPDPTPTPEAAVTLAMWIAPQLADSNSALVEQFASLVRTLSEDSGFELEIASSPDGADVAVALVGEADNGDLVIYGEPLVAVTAPDQRVAHIGRDQLDQLFDGSISDWAELDGQDRPVVPVSHPLAELAGFTAEQQVEHGNDLNGLLSEYPGAVAVIPRSEADFRVQMLIIGEIDPLRDELRHDTWPHWEQIAVRVGDRFDDSFDRRLREAIEDLNEAASRPARTIMSVVGDVMLGRTVHRIMTEQNDYFAPYRLVVDELQRGDLTIGNLECAITGSFSPPADPTTFSFMSFPEAAEGLQYAGFNALSGANNHAMDFGVVGAQDTTAALDEVGIQHFGAGSNLSEAREPCILEHNGVTFALLGYDSISMGYASAGPETGGIAPMIVEIVVDDIERSRERADVVIPFFHWGVEYVLTPLESDRRMARAAIDAGADLVLGGHPHWVQGMEIYDGKPIFYSLSNFVFDQEWSLETKQGLVLHLVFDGAEFAGFRVVPVLIEDYHRPRIVEDEMRATILERYWRSTSLIADAPID